MLFLEIKNTKNYLSGLYNCIDDVQFTGAVCICVSIWQDRHSMRRFSVS